MKTISEIISLAQDILDGKIGIIEGAREMKIVYHSCPYPSQSEDFLPFVAIDSESDHLPIGKVRELWDKEILKEKDKEIVEIEMFYKKNAFEACQKIIQKLKTG